VSKLFRFQTDIQPSLMFIQRAQKKVHLLMERSGQTRFRPLALSTLTLMRGSLLHRPASLSKQMLKTLLYSLEHFDTHSIALRLHWPSALTLCPAAFWLGSKIGSYCFTSPKQTRSARPHAVGDLCHQTRPS
jgi:hypothetical protein